MLKPGAKQDFILGKQEIAIPAITPKTTGVESAGALKVAVGADVAFNTALLHFCNWENEATIVADIGGQTAGTAGSAILGALDAFFFASLLFAGKKEMDDVKRKIARREERNRRLTTFANAINNEKDVGKKNKMRGNLILALTGSSRDFEKIGDSFQSSDELEALKAAAAERKERKFFSDKSSVVASTVSVGSTAYGFTARPFTWMNALGWIIWPITAGCAIAAGIIAYFRGREYAKLQEKAAELKKNEEKLLGEIGITRELSGDVFQDFAAQWGKLLWGERDDTIRINLVKMESLTKDKLAAGVMAGVFASIVFGTLYAALVTVAVGFVAICPPAILFLGIGVIAGLFGKVIYNSIADPIERTANHWFNKIRKSLGLDTRDEKGSGFSAATSIRMIGAAMAVVAMITIPVVGWIAAIAVAVSLAAITAISSHYISKREAKRKNAVKAAQLKMRSEEPGLPRAVSEAPPAAVHVSDSEVQHAITEEEKAKAKDYAKTASLREFAKVLPATEKKPSILDKILSSSKKSEKPQKEQLLEFFNEKTKQQDMQKKVDLKEAKESAEQSIHVDR